MTPTEMRERLAAIDAERRSLDGERTRLVLAIEEAEGRPDSFAARFARAELAHDVAAMTALCAESQVDFRREYGHWPQQEIRDAAERLVRAEENDE